jgi:large subunit ribosomal protein L25
VVVKDLQTRCAASHVDFPSSTPTSEVEVPVVPRSRRRSTKAVRRSATPDITVDDAAQHSERVSIDVSELELGDHVTVADITLPEGVTTPLDPDTIIVTTILPRGEPEPEVAEGEAVEGEEAAAADNESTE